jgi:hypothetical protein
MSNKAFDRTCVVTREKSHRKDLMRIVRLDSNEGYEVRLDISQNLPGRGMYIKPEKEILEKAIKNGYITRHLQLKRALSEEEKEGLRESFLQAFK